METVLDQVCSSCGSARLPYGRYCLFCGDVLSEPSVKVVVSSQNTNPLERSGNLLPRAVEYAGFWRRTAAGTIDVALEAAGALVVTFAIDFAFSRVGHMLGFEPWMSKVATGMAYIGVLAIGAWLYCAFAESSPRRATIGKRIMGLQVVTADGGKVSFGQATVRHFMKFLSLFSAGVGFMMAGWTKRHQALHDIPCDCIVIRSTPVRDLRFVWWLIPVGIVLVIATWTLVGFSVLTGLVVPLILTLVFVGIFVILPISLTRKVVEAIREAKK